MANNTVSLCLIARNEATNIGNCIRSARNFVEEIVVVDTGSSDNTPEIADSLGAKVIKEEWKNNFSIHRNTSIENASSDWILFLDCDEELVQNSGKVLREVIQNDSYEAYFVQIINKVSSGNNTTFPAIRIFKNRKSYRFEGMIHEQIVNSILKKHDAEKISQANIHVIHHGYNSGSVNIQAKVRRNLEILKQYPEEKRNGFFFYNFGTEYLRLGEKKKALENYLKALELTKPGQTYGPILVKKTTTTLMDLKRYRDAIEQLSYYQTIYTDFKDLILLKAFCYLKCGRYSEAKKCLKKYKTMEQEISNLYPEEDGCYGLTPAEAMEKINSLVIDLDYSDISVCIIGRNEAYNLIRCIQSVSEIATEIIFINCDSIDNSYALAYQLGARVYNFEWNYNFSEVRNYALEKVNGDWVLFIDADEMLPEQSRNKIVELVKNAECEGFKLKIITFLDSTLSLSNCDIRGSCRLFRNRDYYYQGVCQEKISTSINETGGTIKTADIQINHFHFSGKEDNIKLKKEIKINTIKKEIKNFKVKNYILGIEFFYHGEYDSAITCFKAIYKNVSPDLLSSFMYYYGQSLINVNNYQQTIEILDQTVKLFDDYTDLYYLQAIAFFMVGEIDRAEKLFKKCIELGDAPWHKYIVNPGTGNFKAMCSLATIYTQQGNNKMALELLLTASSYPGGYKKAIKGIIQVFTGFKMDLTLTDYLKKHDLFNLPTLILIAEVFARRGSYEESLKYLYIAHDYIKEESISDQFPQILRVIENLISNFVSKLNKKFSDNTQFKKVVEFWLQEE